MTDEGELKKRIQTEFGINWESDLCFDIGKIVDEAKKDFPKKQAPLEVMTWYFKWFGGETNNGKL